MKTLFNIFWVIIVGVASAITNALVGVALCCTIIGIPFGLQYFKFIPLAFAPAGKAVATRYGKHPIMNTLWLILCGLEVGVFYMLFGAILCVTIIGIPLGKQLIKIAIFNFAPFGAEIVQDGEYTKDGDTSYDYRKFFPRAAADLDKTVDTNPDGSPKTMRKVFMENREGYNKCKIPDMIVGVIMMLMMFLILFGGSYLWVKYLQGNEHYYIVENGYGTFTDAYNPAVIIGLLVLMAITMLVVGPLSILRQSFYISHFRKTYTKYLRFYPKGSPEVTKNRYIDPRQIYSKIDSETKPMLNNNIRQ